MRLERRNTRIGHATIHSVHAGEGDPVVLLHGLSGSHNWWRFTLPTLARRYTVHVPELVGFGRSRGPSRPGMDEMSALMRAWLDEMHVTRPHLAGHSMGGQIAIHMIADGASVRSLTLACASGFPRDVNVRGAMRLLNTAIAPKRWGAFEFMPTMAADALRAGPRNIVRASLDILADDVTPLLPSVQCPTLVVWGALDPLVPSSHGERFAQLLPNARLVVIADAAHNVMADRPQEFNRVLLDFLDSVDG